MKNSFYELKSCLTECKESQSPDDIFTGLMMDFAVECHGKVAELTDIRENVPNRKNVFGHMSVQNFIRSGLQ